MRTTGRIESLSYVTVYVTGCFVAAFLSFYANNPLEKLVFHTACSWGYVVYYVLNF